VTEVERLTAEVAALRAVIAPQPDESAESFALSVRGVMALLMSEERAQHRALLAHAWAVVDAQYPGDRTDTLPLEAAVAALSGHLNDSGAPR
jgi:hypothetical protein